MRRCCIALAYVAVLLQACVAVSPVESREPVLTSEFDGDWSAVMKSTPSRQSYADFQFDCDEFTESFFLRVRDGVVSGYLEADENYSFRTFVDSAGSFKSFIPLESYYRYKKDAQVERSSIALLMVGHLESDRREGHFVIGDSRMNLNGCTTDIEFIQL